MSIGSLFAGIGGFDLAARWMGWETKWFSEIEPYASAVLKKHWPNVPNHGDITQIRGKDVEQVDILCGGFPCQNISGAGKKEGIDGAKSGLWREYARLIREIRPRYAVIENPAVLIRRGLATVLRDLAVIGYAAEWSVISACSVGAPHTRERVFVVAYSDENSKSLGSFHEEASGVRAYARTMWYRGCPEPGALRMPDGLSNGMDRLRSLGNAVVPQVVEKVFRAIQERERSRS